MNSSEMLPSKKDSEVIKRMEDFLKKENILLIKK